MGLFLTNGIVMANDLQNTTKEWRYYQGNQGQQRPLKDVTPPNTTQRALPPPKYGQAWHQAHLDARQACRE